MKTVLLFLTFMTSVAYGQSVSFSPMSFNFWGRTPGMSSVAIEYKQFGLHYYYPFTPYYYVGDIEHNAPEIPKTQSNIGISYAPIQVFNTVTAGAYIFAKKFPLSHMGQRVNFFVDIGFSVNRFRVSYHHISNGFGLVTEFNPGVDSIRLTIAL